MKKRNRGQTGPGQIEDLTKRDLVVWEDTSEVRHVEAATPALLAQPIHLAKRIRTGHQYKAQRNYHGLYWFSQTGQHVWHESLFEMTALMALDFSGEIDAVSSQPMMMQFADGSVHYPDFFAVHTDHSQVVYDVRPQERISETTAVQFEKTRQLCERVGWKYELFTAISPTVKANLEWLAGYRHPRYTPSAAARAEILTTIETPMSFADLTHTLSMPTPLAVVAIYHLLWNRALQFDMNGDLNSYTILTKGTHRAHA